MFFRLLLIFSSLSFSCISIANVTLTSPSGISDLRQDYMYSLLDAALTATASENEEVKVTKVAINAGYTASTFVVKKGQADVTYFPANIDSEQDLIPIRVPLYKGLMGYRTLLIQKQDQEKFNGITAVDSLKKLVKGSGSRWRTTKVLSHHQFNYITAVRTSSLFKMLSLGRFNYTSRGVIETLEVLKSIETKFPGLKIEDNILLYTELPVYFFVSKNNPELAQRLLDGMMKIASNGKFDDIFNQFYHAILANIKLEDRTIFHLENPYLSAETKANAQTFWQQKMNKPAF